MRLTLQKEREVWRMSDLDAFHLHLLEQVGEDASITDCAEGRERLFPPPIAPSEVPEEKEFAEDWREFVSDELENQFASDVGTLLSDLDNVRAHRTSKENAEPRLLLDVPLDHARAWFSALNQARLMLDQKYKLHPDGDGDFQLMPPDDGSGEDEVRERLSVYIRYEFYAAIQDWLVRRAM